MQSLKEMYPQDWATWSPARRKAEVALKKACERAAKRRDAAHDKAQRLVKEADARYHAERQAALRAYAEGEG